MNSRRRHELADSVDPTRTRAIAKVRPAGRGAQQREQYDWYHPSAYPTNDTCDLPRFKLDARLAHAASRGFEVAKALAVSLPRMASWLVNALPSARSPLRT